jgi:S1-C subfamily serine protease
MNTKINWLLLKPVINIFITLPLSTYLAILPLPVTDWRSFDKIPKIQKIPEESQQIKAKITAITVQVWSNKFLGSGILINRKDDEYLVLTNAHLIQWIKPPYQIKTPDGIMYPAEMKKIDFANTDLRILKFKAPQKNYQIAKKGSFANLKRGDRVFAAGFPLQLPQTIEQLSPDRKKLNVTPVSKDSPNNSQGTSINVLALPGQKINITEGKIFSVLDKPLERGYQIGYTNEIQKGMSGGPVLNEKGELVGINGIHSRPIFVMNTYYEDNSLPTEELQKAIPRYSWAIPIDRLQNFIN